VRSYPKLCVYASAATLVCVLWPVIPARSAFPGRNGLIAFSTVGGEIATIRADGTGFRLLIPGSAEAPAWSADGSQIAFMVSGAHHRLAIAAADGSLMRFLTDASGNDNQPSWSPDGRFIVFSDIDADISEVSVDGGKRSKLTHSGGVDLLPAFSPNGKWIVYSGERQCAVRYLKTCSWKLFVMNADGSGIRRLTSGPGDDLGAAWSPDGSQLVFTHRNDTGDALATLPAAGGRMKLLSPYGTYYLPAWSPDGTRIVFSRTGGLWTALPNGSGAERLTSTPAGADNPDWQPVSTP
jgi:TolB protein